jgi:hypothetical protein
MRAKNRAKQESNQNIDPVLIWNFLRSLRARSGTIGKNREAKKRQPVVGHFGFDAAELRRYSRELCAVAGDRRLTFRAMRAK